MTWIVGMGVGRGYGCGSWVWVNVVDKKKKFPKQKIKKLTKNAFSRKIKETLYTVLT